MDTINRTFIEKALIVHGDEFEYSLVKYINSKTKISIICRKHGLFEQTPNNHLCGQKCPTCKNKIKFDNNHFIKKALLYTKRNMTIL